MGVINRILCRLFGHPGFSKNWLVVEEWWKDGREEQEEYLGERCVRCGTWRYPKMNLDFINKGG